MAFGIKASLINAYVNTGPEVSRWAQRTLATVGAAKGDLTFYWSAACPYSYLMAQQLSALVAQTDATVVVVPVPMGAADVNPEPALREEHGPRDCTQLAAFYDLHFPADWTLPAAEAVAVAVGIVASAVTAADSGAALRACIDVGRALWGGDAERLRAAAERFDRLDDDATAATLARNAKGQRRAGHYHPATIRYFGEWFEGPMRLGLVADRLRGAGHEVGAGDTPRRLPTQLERAPEGSALEFWFSFRSPYSYLAAAQVQAWRQAGDQFELRFRPVLPMVMRGLAVPRIKKMFLVKDAAREARKLGIPFGKIADPVGSGAERCLAVCAAVSTGARTNRAWDFAVSASRAIWSEGLDVATNADLIEVARRADISAGEVSAALGDLAAGAALAEENRVALLEAGLWGVPSFRSGHFVTWGQDRLPLVRHVLRL